MDELILIKTDKYTEIYSDMLTQFPADELKTFNEFTELLKNDNYEIYEAADSEGNRAGYLIVLSDLTNKTVWLDYLAVCKEYHSRGYGKKIISALKKQFKDFKGCWLEVEKPDSKIPNTLRRIKFYLREGALLSDCNYLYPNKNGCLPMDLYFIPFAENGIPHYEILKNCTKYTFSILHKNLKHTDKVFKNIFLD